jgi:hypothetical protein
VGYTVMRELEIEVAVVLCCDLSVLRCIIRVHQQSTRSSPGVWLLYVPLSQNIAAKTLKMG